MTSTDREMNASVQSQRGHSSSSAIVATPVSARRGSALSISAPVDTGITGETTTSAAHSGEVRSSAPVAEQVIDRLRWWRQRRVRELPLPLHHVVLNGSYVNYSAFGTRPLAPEVRRTLRKAVEMLRATPLLSDVESIALPPPPPPQLAAHLRVVAPTYGPTTERREEKDMETRPYVSIPDTCTPVEDGLCCASSSPPSPIISTPPPQQFKECDVADNGIAVGSRGAALQHRHHHHCDGGVRHRRSLAARYTASRELLRFYSPRACSAPARRGSRIASAGGGADALIGCHKPLVARESWTAVKGQPATSELPLSCAGASTAVVLHHPLRLLLHSQCLSPAQALRDAQLSSHDAEGNPLLAESAEVLALTELPLFGFERNFYMNQLRYERAYRCDETLEKEGDRVLSGDTRSDVHQTTASRQDESDCRCARQAAMDARGHYEGNRGHPRTLRLRAVSVPALPLSLRGLKFRKSSKGNHKRSSPAGQPLTLQCTGPVKPLVSLLNPPPSQSYGGYIRATTTTTTGVATVADMATAASHLCLRVDDLQDHYVFNPLYDCIGTGAFSQVFAAVPILRGTTTSSVFMVSSSASVTSSPAAQVVLPIVNSGANEHVTSTEGSTAQTARKYSDEGTATTVMAAARRHQQQEDAPAVTIACPWLSPGVPTAKGGISSLVTMRTQAPTVALKVIPRKAKRRGDGNPWQQQPLAASTTNTTTNTTLPARISGNGVRGPPYPGGIAASSTTTTNANDGIVGHNSQRRELVEVEREIAVLRQLRHTGCSRYYEALRTPDEFVIAMTLHPGSMDAREYLSRYGPPTEARAALIIFQLMETVRYLHDEFGLIHRDIKLENVLVSLVDATAERIQQILGPDVNKSGTSGATPTSQNPGGCGGGGLTSGMGCSPVDEDLRSENRKKSGDDDNGGGCLFDRAAGAGVTMTTEGEEQRRRQTQPVAHEAVQLLRTTLIDFGLARRTKLSRGAGATPSAGGGGGSLGTTLQSGGYNNGNNNASLHAVPGPSGGYNGSINNSNNANLLLPRSPHVSLHRSASRRHIQQQMHISSSQYRLGLPSPAPSTANMFTGYYDVEDMVDEESAASSTDVSASETSSSCSDRDDEEEEEENESDNEMQERKGDSEGHSLVCARQHVSESAETRIGISERPPLGVLTGASKHASFTLTSPRNKIPDGSRSSVTTAPPASATTTPLHGGDSASMLRMPSYASANALSMDSGCGTGIGGTAGEGDTRHHRLRQQSSQAVATDADNGTNCNGDAAHNAYDTSSTTTTAEPEALAAGLTPNSTSAKAVQFASSSLSATITTATTATTQEGSPRAERESYEGMPGRQQQQQQQCTLECGPIHSASRRRALKRSHSCSGSMFSEAVDGGNNVNSCNYNNNNNNSSVNGDVLLLLTPCGTEKYLPPEMLEWILGHSWTRKSTPLSLAKQLDLYALGVVTYVLLSGCFPFNATTTATHLQQQRRVPRCNSARWSGVSGTAISFVQGLLEPNPEKRMTARQALEHPFLKEASVYARKLQLVPDQERPVVPVTTDTAVGLRSCTATVTTAATATTTTTAAVTCAASTAVPGALVSGGLGENRDHPPVPYPSQQQQQQSLTLRAVSSFTEGSMEFTSICPEAAHTEVFEERSPLMAANVAVATTTTTTSTTTTTAATTTIPSSLPPISSPSSQFMPVMSLLPLSSCSTRLPPSFLPTESQSLETGVAGSTLKAAGGSTSAPATPGDDDLFNQLYNDIMCGE